MSWRMDISLIPRLVQGEKVLYVKKWLWAASGKSLPSYRLFFSLPPVQEAGLYITDRRILMVSYLLRILVFETSIWFPGCAESGTNEVMQTAAIGRMPVFGNYLEIISENPVRSWYRSRQARIRLFMSDPQPLYDLITQVLNG